MLKEPPDNLRLLIERYNGYPVDLQPPSLSQASLSGSVVQVSESEFSPFERTEEQWAERMRFELAKSLIPANESLIAHVLGSDTDYAGGIGAKTADEILIEEAIFFEGYKRRRMKDVWLQTMGFVQRYEEFLVLRFNLDLVIAYSFRHPSWRTSIEATNWGFRSRTAKHMQMLREGLESKDLSFSPLVVGSNRILAGEDGIANTRTDEISSALDGTEIFRIRKCAVCYRAFWANHVLQFWCREGCRGQLKSQLNRVSKWSTEEREEFNKKRRENYRFRMAVRKPLL